MSRIKEIVQYINAGIQAKALQDARFDTACLNGIAVGLPYAGQSSDVGAIVPLILDDNGEADYQGFDDLKCLQIYHKNNGITYQNDKVNYGSNNSKLTRTVSMSMIVMAKRNKIRLSPEEVEMLIITGMPSTIDTATLKDLNLNSALITPIGSDFNFLNVYKREFQYQAPVEVTFDIMLEIKYKLECNLTRECVNILCC